MLSRHDYHPFVRRECNAAEASTTIRKVGAEIAGPISNGRSGPHEQGGISLRAAGSRSSATRRCCEVMLQTRRPAGTEGHSVGPISCACYYVMRWWTVEMSLYWPSKISPGRAPAAQAALTRSAMDDGQPGRNPGFRKRHDEIGELSVGVNAMTDGDLAAHGQRSTLRRRVGARDQESS